MAAASDTATFTLRVGSTGLIESHPESRERSQAPAATHRHAACSPSAVVTALQHFLVRHHRLVRVAWLLGLLLLAACQPDSNGGGDPGDGY